jgi:hypothetical protein
MKRKRVVRKKKSRSDASSVASEASGSGGNAATALQELVEPRPARKSQNKSTADDDDYADVDDVDDADDADDDDNAAPADGEGGARAAAVDDAESSSSEPEFVEFYRNLEQAVRGAKPDVAVEHWTKALQRLAPKDAQPANERVFVRQQALPRFVTVVLARDSFPLADVNAVVQFLRRALPMLIEGIDENDNSLVIQVTFRGTVRSRCVRAHSPHSLRRLSHDCWIVNERSTRPIDQTSLQREISCDLSTLLMLSLGA